MTRPIGRFFAFLQVLAVLGGCSGGGAGGGSSESPNSVAAAEAKRMAAGALVLRDLGSVLLVALGSSTSAQDMGSASVPCTSGGQVQASVSSTASRRINRFTYTNCAEQIGVINGVVETQILSESIDSQGAGNFQGVWTASIDIDDKTYHVERTGTWRTDRLANGAGFSIKTTTGDPSNFVVSTDGRTNRLTANIEFDYDSRGAVLDVANSRITLADPESSDIRIELRFGSMKMQVSPTAAAKSLSNPTAGQLDYIRSLDSTVADIEGRASASGGSVGLTLSPLPQRGFGGDAGQFVWTEIVAAACGRLDQDIQGRC